MSKWREKNAPATGGGQSPGTGMAPGSEHTPASGGYRSAPKQIAPNTKVNASHIHTWCWTGALQGARVYMAARQWSLEQMESQVSQVPDVLKYARTQKVLTQDHASDHDLYLTIQGGFNILIGWSVYLDQPGMSHGWFKAGAFKTSVLKTEERLYKALEVMLMCMGYDCPSDCTPIEPAPGGMKSTRSKNKNKKNRRAKQAQEQQTNLKEQQPRPQAPEPVAAAASAGAASSSAGSASLARAITAPLPTPVATSELASGSEQQLHQLPSEPQPQPQPQPPPQQSSQQPPRQEHTPQPGTTNELASGSKQQLPPQQEQQEQLQLPEQQEQLQLPQQQEQQVQPQQPQQPQQAEQQVQQQPLGQTLQQQPQQLQPQPMAMWPPMATMALQQHAVMVSAVSQQQHQWQHVQPQQQQELQFQQQWHQQHQDQLLQQQLLQQWQHGQEQQQQQQQQQQLLQQQQQIWQLQQQVWSQQQQQQTLLQQIEQQHRDLQPQQQQQQQPPPLHGTSPASGGTESEESEIEDESDEEEEEEEETWTWTKEDQARWREAVASVCRVHGRQPQRVGANLYQKRAPAVKLEEADMDRMSTLMQEVAEWGGFSSRDLVQRDGIQNSTKRMLGKQLEMLKNHRPAFLLSRLPPDPSRPLAAPPSDPPAAWEFIKDLLTRHRGEVREISGEWTVVAEPFPDKQQHPEYFHAQFCLSDAEARSMITWDGTGGRSQSFLAGKAKGKKPASGGTGKGDEEPEDNTMVMRQTRDQSMHWRREAAVCGLADLFAQFGDTWAAHDIYGYYTTMHVIVHKREHGVSAPERRKAAHERFRASGRWGHWQ